MMIFERIHAYVLLVAENQRRYNRGQGVIEYAGALVIAAVLVSLVLVVVPTPFTDFFFTIMEQTLNFFIDFLP